MLQTRTGLMVRDLRVVLGQRRVLDRVSLDVGPGEVVALEGASGAGKTTLVRAIAGLVPIEGGLVTGMHGANHSRPAIVFQHHALAPRLTALENVLVGALGRIGFWRATLRLWPATEVADARSCLARVGLTGLDGRRSDRLSGGQRQRVAIARALAQRAPILLADEPVASLDPESAQAILALLRDLAREDSLTVLMCLHQPDLARRFADRTLRLEQGKVIET
jgi:phosphonate transport system ATP-binding protein